MLLTSAAVTSIIMLLGGLGAFLIGFKLLSDNVEKVANSGLKRLFNKAGGNRFVGVGIGAAATAVIQSSSATTVMIVGFVNSGIMTLATATAMIMGANIGTTITAQIVSLKSFDISLYAIVLTALGIFMQMFAKKDKTKAVAMAIAGLGLVFFGLENMANSMSYFSDNPAFTNALQSVNNPILLLLIGIGLTAILQSSSAVTTMVISMVAAGITIGNDPNSVLFVVLGTNIGTCVTALLSSVGANVNAKRTAIIHLFFNVFGSIIFVVLLLIWKNFMNDVLASWLSKPSSQIAMFHTIFNVICTLIFIPFVNGFVKLSNLIIKDKKNKNEEDNLGKNLDDRLLKTPSIALQQVVKEITNLGDLAMGNLNISVNAFFQRDESVELTVKNNNEKIDILNKAIIQYLVKISTEDISMEDETLISKYHHTLTDLIREAEIADNVVKYIKKVNAFDITFSDSVYDSIRDLLAKLNEQYENVNKILLDNDLSSANRVAELEDEIDALRSQLIDDHIKRLEEGKCKPQSSGVFINFISNLERAGDHLEVISQTLTTSKGN